MLGESGEVHPWLPRRGFGRACGQQCPRYSRRRAGRLVTSTILATLASPPAEELLATAPGLCGKVGCMGHIAVHEFISLDGVFESRAGPSSSGSTPRWVRPSPASPAAPRRSCWPQDVRDVRAGVVRPHRGRGPGGAVLQRDHQVRRRGQEPSEEWGPASGSGLTTPRPSDGSRTRPTGRSTSPAAAACAGLLRRRPGRRAPPVRLPHRARGGGAAVHRGQRPDEAGAQASDVYANGVVHLSYGPASTPTEQA